MSYTSIKPATRTHSKAGVSTKRWRMRTSVFYEALFVCFLLSVYTEVPLVIGSDLLIPSFVTVLFLLPVLGVVFCNTIYKYEARFVAAIFLVLLLSILLSPGFDFVGQKLLGLLQLMVSITGGVLLVKLIGRLNRKRAANMLLTLAVILVVGASLEVLGVLREASDAFRDVAYNPTSDDAIELYGLYDAPTRDASLTGFPRPNFFVSEPSILATSYLVFVNAWLLLAYTNKNYFFGCLMTLILFILTGSPVLALSAVASTAIALYSEKRFVRVIPGAMVFLIAFFVAVAVSPEVFSNMIERFDTVLIRGFDNERFLSNDSIGLRLVLPTFTVIDVLQSSPLFGVGISGKEVIELYSSLSLTSREALGTNNLATLFIYLGVVGSVLFARIFLGYLRRNKIKQISLLIILVLALSVSMGGFETLRFWGFVFLFIGVMKLRSNAWGTERRLQPEGSSRFQRPRVGRWR